MKLLCLVFIGFDIYNLSVHYKTIKSYAIEYYSFIVDFFTNLNL